MAKTIKVVKQTENIIKIAQFKLLYKHNIDALSIALLNCGYYVKVYSQDETSSKTVNVYLNQ